MKTLLLTEIFPPRTGGSGRWFWEVYRRLPRERYLVAAGEVPGQAEFDATHDVRLHRLPLTQASWGVCSVAGLRNYWRTFRAVRHLVKAEKIGQVHCGRCLPEGWVAWMLWRWLGLPYLCYAHGEEMNYATSSRELSWMVRRVLAGAQCVIANSSNTENMLREHWHLPAERIRLLHPGADTGRFVPAPRDPLVRQELGWGERPVVLTVGRLQKRKGHDTMIRALPVIRRTIPDVLYAVVGDGEERRSLEELVVAEGVADHVQFCGELDDTRMIRCYQQCDLFVLANRQVGEDIEGFGMVLVEAQACGKPVVAGTSGGTSETMQVPETGQLVPCEQPDELAGLVAGLLTDRPRLARMGARARGWAVERFDWSAVTRRSELIFGAEQTRNGASHAGSTNSTPPSRDQSPV
jgi:phosphatidylinositol alpha-1,6-mannosyltransferase